MDKNEQIKLIEWKIRKLKQKLAETDYKAIKFAEGELTEEEYAPIREERRAWRDEINAMEAELVELKTEVQG